MKNEKSKMAACEMYMVVKKEDDWLLLKKFTNNQLRNREYWVHSSDIFCITPDVCLSPNPKTSNEMSQIMDEQDVPTAPSHNATAKPPQSVRPKPVPVQPLPGMYHPAPPPDLPIIPQEIMPPTIADCQPSTADAELETPEPASGQDLDYESESSAEPDQDTVATPAQPQPPPPGPRRSQRTKFASTRLKDFVYFLIGLDNSEEEGEEEEDTTPRCQ